jgi:hypothetical protein
VPIGDIARWFEMKEAANRGGVNSMYDFSCRIAAGEKFPSLALSFKPFDPAVLKHDPPAPECVKLATG